MISTLGFNTNTVRQIVCIILNKKSVRIFITLSTWRYQNSHIPERDSHCSGSYTVQYSSNF